MEKKITLIGAGIAGLTSAIALKNIGIDAMVFEAAPEIKPVGSEIALGANAMSAFNLLGIEKEIIELGQFIDSFTIYDQKGRQISKTERVRDGNEKGINNFIIHRADLHRLLLSKINPEAVILNKRIDHIEQFPDSVIIYFQDGTNYETNYLIASDGIHSVVRKHFLNNLKPRYSGYTCWRAVIDNTALQINESSETWGENGRFGLVPLGNDKLYWFACINSPEKSMKELKIEHLIQNFENYHEPIPSILRQTGNEKLVWGDINDIKPIEKFAYNNVLLIGDAAHATTPNLGQGACQAIEDAVILADEIKNNDDIAKAFKFFERRRLNRTHWIVNESAFIGKLAQIQNKILIKIRDFVMRLLPKFLQERRLEKMYKTDF
jgi:2-polyprenyl-6-methoxyphenol hydroxylase-like FAD-dependent oxidoreductase